VRILQDIIGSHVSPLYEEARQGDVRHSLADIRRGKTILNYDPKVGIEEGLRRTVEFFKK
jgi:nucleoside-diphosphate-sugar epimerase